MALSRIDALMESLSEDYLRNMFADRLESTRLAVDDEQFGSVENAADAVRAFLALTPEQRSVEMERVKIVAAVINWANDASIEDINSLISILRREKDSRTEETEPETPEMPEMPDTSEQETPEQTEIE